MKEEKKVRKKEEEESENKRKKNKERERERKNQKTREALLNRSIQTLTHNFQRLIFVAKSCFTVVAFLLLLLLLFELIKFLFSVCLSFFLST